MRVLSAKDVRAAVTMNDVIDAVREGFIALVEGRAVAPLRGVMDTGNGITLAMPAQIQGADERTVKLVSVFPGNPARGLPTIHAVVMVFDAVTGAPIALMDGTELTAMRTGAASGLATALLARKESSVLACIGSAAQARTQIEAVCAVRDIKAIRIYSPNNATKLADELQAAYDAEVRAVDSSADAVRDADVVVAATNSKTPVVHYADLAPGTHVNGVGSFTAEMQEIDADLVVNATVIIDDANGAWEEAGDLIIPRDQGLFTESDVHALIGEIANGTRPGRTAADEITFFKSVGNAVQDATVAGRIAAIAQQRDLGAVVDL